MAEDDLIRYPERSLSPDDVASQVTCQEVKAEKERAKQGSTELECNG